MDLKLGEIRIDAAMNLSLVASGATEPYLVIKIDPASPIADLYRGMENEFVNLIKGQLKIP